MKAKSRFILLHMIACYVLLFASILIGITCRMNAAHNDDPDTVTDVEGNEYRTVRIGSQVWLAENLRVTHFRNGDAIPLVTDENEWFEQTAAAFCHFDNDTNLAETYGFLYNWFAVQDDRDIAPEGWHVATDEDWKELEMVLGMGLSDADIQDDFRGTGEGGKLKEAGTLHWKSPNSGATNATLFTALPGGYRDFYDCFTLLGYRAIYWTSTETDSYYALVRGLEFNQSGIYRGRMEMTYGCSVRCVKD